MRERQLSILFAGALAPREGLANTTTARCALHDAARTAKDMPELDLVHVSNADATPAADLVGIMSQLADALVGHPAQPWTVIEDDDLLGFFHIFRLERVRAYCSPLADVMDIRRRHLEAA